MEGLSLILFLAGLACLYRAGQHPPYVRVIGRDHRDYAPGRDHNFDREFRCRTVAEDRTDRASARASGSRPGA